MSESENVPTITVTITNAKLSDTLQPTSLQLPPTTAELKAYLLKVSVLYGQDYQKMAATIRCESSWKTNTYSTSHISYGISQFTPATWKDYGIGDYKNPFDQLLTMAKMWRLGLAKRWDCYHYLFGSKTGT